jgi:MFS family permease
MTAIWDFVAGVFGSITTILTLLTPIFVLVSGIISLFFGRKFFWVFVAAVGFLLGLYISDFLLPVLPAAVAPFNEFIRLAVGLTFAGFALIIQRAGTIVIGAVATGLLAWWAGGHYEIVGWAQWAVAAVGGLMGGVLLYFALDWALVLLTALAGGLITIAGMGQLNGLPTASGPWFYLVLLVAGIFYQRRELMQDRPARAAAPAAAPKTRRSRRRKGAAADAMLAEAQLQPLEVATVGTPVPAPVTSAASLAQSKATSTTAAAVAQPAPAKAAPIQPAPVSKAFIPVPLTATPVAPAPVSAAEVAAASKRKRFNVNLNLRWPRRTAAQPLPEAELQPLETTVAETLAVKPGAPTAGTIYMGTSTGGINYAPAPKPTYQVYG